MTPTNEAGHALPELPEWSKRDDLGGLVPSQIRSELRAYARAVLALSRGVPADMVLVPVKPTEAMLDAADTAGDWGYDSLGGRFDNGNGDEIWAAMIAAAPAAAGAQGGDAKPFNAGWMEGHDKGWSSGYQRGLYDAAGMPHDFDWDDAKAKAHEAFNNTPMPQQSVAAPQPAAADGGVRERARELLADAQQRADGHGVNARLILDEGMSLRCNVACDVALHAVSAALSSHRQAGEVAGLWPSIPSIQRWKMERGSDGHRWSVYMDHCKLGEWCKWEDVQQAWFCQALALVEKGAGNG